MAKVRVALVGAGEFGRNHLRVLNQSEQAELVAVVDADPSKAHTAAGQYGCIPLEDYRELA